MRQIMIWTLCCFGLMPVMAQRATSFTFKGSYTDNYVFRGHLYNSGETALGEFTVGKGKWSYSLLYATPFDEMILDDGSEFFKKETTHNISYTTVTRGSIITYGYQFMDYEGIWPDTQEFYMRVARTSPWNPTYGVAFDIDTYKGYYFDASITRFWPFSRHTKLLINALAGLSYNLGEETSAEGVITEPRYFEDDGLNHATAQFRILWQPTNRFKFETGGDYHYSLDDFLMDDAPDDFEYTLVASFTISL